MKLSSDLNNIAKALDLVLGDDQNPLDEILTEIDELKYQVRTTSEDLRVAQNINEERDRTIEILRDCIEAIKGK